MVNGAFTLFLRLKGLFLYFYYGYFLRHAYTAYRKVQKWMRGKIDHEVYSKQEIGRQGKLWKLISLAE